MIQANAINLAFSVGGYATIEDTLVAGNTNWYQFSINAGETFSASVLSLNDGTNPSQVDLVLALVAPDGSVIAESTGTYYDKEGTGFGDEQNAAWIDGDPVLNGIQALEAGTIYLAVSGQNANAFGKYLLTVIKG